MRKKYAIIMAEWRKTMGVTYVKEVISPEELFERYPLPEAHKKQKKIRRLPKSLQESLISFWLSLVLVLPTMKMLYVITHQDLPKFRKKLMIRL